MDRLYQFSATFPAGTLPGAPSNLKWTLEDNLLRRIEITVPDGPSGLMSFRILQAGQQIVPWANNSFITANDEKILVEFEDQISASGLVIQGFNTDIFDHTVYFRATITNLPLPGSLPPAAVVGTFGLAPTDIANADGLDLNAILDSDFTDDGLGDTGDNGDLGIEPVDTKPDIPPPHKTGKKPRGFRPEPPKQVGVGPVHPPVEHKPPKPELVKHGTSRLPSKR